MMSFMPGYKQPNLPPRPDQYSNGIEITNVAEGETVYQRFLLVNGRAGARNGKFEKALLVLCNDFPQTEWPCVDSYFKALVHLTPGPNTITFLFDGEPSLHFHLNYLPLVNNPPLSLVIMIGADSPGTFDVPPEKAGQNTLAIAIEKLRTAGYMWQAFCGEQLYRHGMGRRTFQLDEAWLPDTISCQDKGTMRHTAKVHVLRSKYTVQEIRDIRRAQQGSHDEHKHKSLFDLFLETLQDHPPFDKACTVAGLILDSHWDVKVQVSLGHTALGGGAGDTALGVFGSHLLHAWPTCIEDIVPSFMNDTVTDTRYVANDANESGRWWRAANIGMGAMLHEVGHAFSLGHSGSGIMSRGYNNWNRTFLAKEPGLSPIPPEKENGSHWHRSDIIRLRYHAAFRLPSDGPKGPVHLNSPQFLSLGQNRFQIRSSAGLVSLEILVNRDFKRHLEYPDLPTQVTLTLDDVRSEPGKLSLIALGANHQQTELEDLDGFLQDVTLPGVSGHVVKSPAYGNQRLKPVQVGFRKRLVSIVVNHGGALDGFRLVWEDGVDQVGKTGGCVSEFQVLPGERIEALVVRSGAWIDGVQFRMTGGRLSPWFGSQGGTLHVLEPPAGFEIVGLYGAWKNWMEQLGIYYRQI